MFWELNDYSHSDYYGFHMPGHKRNKNLTGAGLPYEIDITEIEGFDDLHHAKGMLKHAQERAAEIFHGEETCFLINGSTVGILSAILGCTKRGDKILMARNCHRSVYHAVYMNELKTEYVYPLFYNQRASHNSCPCGTDRLRSTRYKEQELNGEINPDDVRDILERDRNSLKTDLLTEGNDPASTDRFALSIESKYIRAVVITSPTYDGVVSNVEKIAEIVHSYGIPLIVDEAHGAHFGFHPHFPENSNMKGADVVIHSIHKTLPSLTQTALIHMNGNFADRERIKKYLHILQTSSPSYVLMAGIDVCVDWLASEEKDILFDKYVEILKETREQLKKMRHLHMVETENFDDSKIVISVKGTGYSGRELYDLLLEKYHLQMEMAAGSYVLAMTSVGDIKEGFQRLVQALYEIDRGLDEENDPAQNSRSEKGRAVCQISVDSSLDFTGLDGACNWNKENEAISQAFTGLPKLEQIFTSAETEHIGRENKKNIRVLPWECCPGNISMEYAYLYPPGIPLIVPGEKISEEVINLIQKYRNMGFDIEGLKKDGYITAIKV